MKNKNTSIIINIKFALVLLMAFGLLFPNEFRISGIYTIHFLILSIILLTTVLIHKFSIPKEFKNLFFFSYFLVIPIETFYHNSIKIGIFFFLQTVGILLIVYNGIKNKSQFDYSLEFLIKIFGILSVLGIIETFTNFNIFDCIRNVNTQIDTGLRFGLHRSRGMMVVCQNYGIFLIMAASLTFYQIQNWKNKKIYKIIYILISINELCTLTRATIAAFIVTQVILVIKCGEIKRFKVWIRGIIVFVILYFVVTVLKIESVNNALNSIYSMFIAVLDPEAASQIANQFGTNVGGIGQRLDLYGWILEEIQGHELLGLGPYEVFIRVVNADFTKTSIENQYLSLLFHYGWVGLGSYILWGIAYMCYLTKKFIADKRQNSRTLSFNFVMLTFMAVYFIALFTCAEIDEVYLIMYTMGLTFSHNLLKSKGAFQ
jgi:hypothetical protein